MPWGGAGSTGLGPILFFLGCPFRADLVEAGELRRLGQAYVFLLVWSAFNTQVHATLPPLVAIGPHVLEYRPRLLGGPVDLGVDAC